MHRDRRIQIVLTLCYTISGLTPCRALMSLARDQIFGAELYITSRGHNTSETSAAVIMARILTG